MNATVMRSIKSFIKREGRFTKAQEKSLSDNWLSYGLEHRQGYLSPELVFKRNAPLVIEIGFGMGASFLQTVKKEADTDFIGIEVHRPGVGAFLRQVDAAGLSNVRVYCHDAVEILRDCIPDNRLDKVCIFFPDPWPKKRHHKRRLVQPEFVALIEKKLKPDGLLHLATDWEDYAQHMLQVLKGSSLKNTSMTDDFVLRPESRCVTKYEHRGVRLGHVVRDLVFCK